MTRSLIALAVVTTALAVSPGSVRATGQAPAAAQTQTARPMFDQYCVSCHNDRLKTGNLVLTGIDANDARQHAALLEKVVRKLRGGSMPPAGSPRPDAATLASFIASVETTLDREAAAAPNPGRVASRRLNRSEHKRRPRSADLK
jgi:mono/diheme cytochrome c family protein